MLGSVRDVSPAHRKNILSPMVTAPVSVSEARPVQSAKAKESAVVNVSGIARQVSPLHPRNADAPTVVKDVGSAREVSPVQ